MRAATRVARRVSIPPELATCPECLAEVFDPADRRYLYPFTNCTNCGPRYTIARDSPYDRPVTTMAAFTMCRECQREYDDPLDRRFHAQPNACPACGPRLRLLDGRGHAAPGDAIPEAARALRAGRIVAVKGLGGYHLACDATSSAATSRLRERKQRDEKPFAVMVRGLAEARALARIVPAEERPARQRWSGRSCSCAGGRRAAWRPRWRRATRSSACCSRTRRCTTCCSPRPAGRW